MCSVSNAAAFCWPGHKWQDIIDHQVNTEDNARRDQYGGHDQREEKDKHLDPVAWKPQKVKPEHT